MTKTKTIKGFDCVDMKRKAQEKIYRVTKDMTSVKELEYIHDQVRNGPFAAMWHGGKKTAKSA